MLKGRFAAKLPPSFWMKLTKLGGETLQLGNKETKRRVADDAAGPGPRDQDREGRLEGHRPGDQGEEAQSRGPLHHRQAPAGVGPEAEDEREPHHAERPAAVRGRGLRRRPRGPHHLHAHGLAPPGPRGHRRHPGLHREEVRQGLPARQGPHLHGQGRGPGRPRGHPPHGHRAHPREPARTPGARPVPPLRPHLAAHHGLARWRPPASTRRWCRRKPSSARATALFEAKGEIERFPGWLAVYRAEKTETEAEAITDATKGDEEDEDEALLPALKLGETLKLEQLDADQQFTKPPARFNEATLVKELEEDGIGRPSTYASIISTIQDRDYVKKHEGRFKPTELGMVVTDLLVQGFPRLLDSKYTSGMEGNLDRIEDGELTFKKAMKDFYGPFEKALAAAGKDMQNLKAGMPTGEKCPKCGAEEHPGVLLKRIGKNGLFLGCTNYAPSGRQVRLHGGAGADGGARGRAGVPALRHHAHDPAQGPVGPLLGLPQLPQVQGHREGRSQGHPRARRTSPWARSAPTAASTS